MRKLATIRTISDIRPIQGADRIEVAQVDGWECVVKKGEFHIGEKIVYVEVDSIMPEKPEFFDMVSEYEKRLSYAKEHTALPANPDMKKVEEFVMDINWRSCE